jgi:hypothetical protein
VLRKALALPKISVPFNIAAAITGQYLGVWWREQMHVVS